MEGIVFDEVEEMSQVSCPSRLHEENGLGVDEEKSSFKSFTGVLIL